MEVRGTDEALNATLKRALAVQTDETRIFAHVHGFHSYPARLHPDTARVLIEQWSQGTDAVLDPFCGSGTVPITARELGRRALGSDLNPLAVALTRLKTRGANEVFADELVEAATQVAEHGRERQKAKLGPTHPYGPEDREAFETYVLLGLDGLRDGIDRLEREDLATALYLVLSAVLTKVSKRRGDSSEGLGEKRLARSFAFRFFQMKTEELSQRLLDYSSLVPNGTPRALIEHTDARDLHYVRDASVRLVVSSPPYPGVYDYYDHHAMRLRWLRMPAEDFLDNEIGTRRGARAATNAITRWEQDFTQCLAELRRVLVPGGRAALVLADSVVAGTAYYADEWLPRLLRQHGFVLHASASQARPHFHEPTERAFAKKPRREHVIVFDRPIDE